VLGVIAERPGVTVTEIAQVTGITKPLVYNTTRAGVERGELERIALPGSQQGFRVRKDASATETPTSMS
jgi:DNA-binding MarR family transcriptional regulator